MGVRQTGLAHGQGRQEEALATQVASRLIQVAMAGAAGVFTYREWRSQVGQAVTALADTAILNGSFFDFRILDKTEVANRNDADNLLFAVPDRKVANLVLGH